jgi:hypothetical protein
MPSLIPPDEYLPQALEMQAFASNVSFENDAPSTEPSDLPAI